MICYILNLLFLIYSWKNGYIYKTFLAIPATSAPIERVFSQAVKIVRSDRCHLFLIAKNFENLVLLKVNQS